MELDGGMIKLLSSDTRVRIIRLLGERRHTPSELSRKLGKSPSTVVEHLKKLEKHGLVRRVSGKNKWVYYELTPEGRKLIDKKDMRIVIPLTLGILLLFAGVFLTPMTQKRYISEGKPKFAIAAYESTSKVQTREIIKERKENVDLHLLMILAGITLILYTVKKFIQSSLKW